MTHYHSRFSTPPRLTVTHMFHHAPSPLLTHNKQTNDASASLLRRATTNGICRSQPHPPHPFDHDTNHARSTHRPHRINLLPPPHAFDACYHPPTPLTRFNTRFTTHRPHRLHFTHANWQRTMRTGRLKATGEGQTAAGGFGIGEYMCTLTVLPPADPTDAIHHHHHHASNAFSTHRPYLHVSPPPPPCI